MCHRYMYIVLYICRFANEMCQVWCSSIQGIYAQLEGGSQSAIGICALFYI